jgi:GNAT superfamily N-acetyltransferase
MYGRIGPDYRGRSREANKADFKAIVTRGPPPGLLAFDGTLAVGWCQVTPRDTVPWLDRSWRLKRVDGLPVWSLSCLYVRKGWRRQGITSVLIAAALGQQRSAPRRRRSRPIPSMLRAHPAPRAAAMLPPSRAPAFARSPAASPPARSCVTISRGSGPAHLDGGRAGIAQRLHIVHPGARLQRGEIA